MTQPESPPGILDLLDRGELTAIVGHYAEAVGVASGIVRWSDSLGELVDHDMDTLDQTWLGRFEGFRLTPVMKESLLCKAIREKERWDLHCYVSDARHCRESRNRGRAVVYRCHAGLLDFVCPVYVGTHHVANVYGGQVLLPEGTGAELSLHECLRPYLAHEQTSPWRPMPLEEFLARHDSSQLCSCLREMPPERLVSLATQVVTKTPDELLRAVILLQEIADLLSTRATETAALRVLSEVETEISEALSPEEGLRTYLNAAGRLVAMEKAVVLFQRREAQQMEAAACLRVGADEASRLAKEAVTRRGPRAIDVAEEKVREIVLSDGCGTCDVVPMFAGDRCVGCWIVVSTVPSRLPKRALALLGTFAAQAGSFASSASEIEILADVQHQIAAVAMHPDIKRLPRAITDGATRLYGAAGPTGLWLFNCQSGLLEHWEQEGDPFNQQQPLPVLGDDGTPASISGQAVSERRAVWEGDISQSALHRYPHIAEAHQLSAVLSIPLLTGRRVVGVLNIHQHDKERPTPRQRALLEAYGRSTAHAIQTWELQRLGRALDACEYAEELAQQLQSDMTRHTGSTFGCVWQYVEKSRRYVLGAVWGYDARNLQAAPPRNSGFTERLRKERQPIMVSQTDRQNTRPEVFDGHPCLRCWIGIPLLSGSRFVGALYLGFGTPRDNGWDELQFLSSYAGCVAITLDRIMRADTVRCAELLATHSLAGEAARHARTSYLASIDECAATVGFTNPDVARDIHDSVAAIREIDDQNVHLSGSEPIESVRLKQLVGEQWERAIARAHNRYNLKDLDQWTWPSDSLKWPQAQLRRVIDIILENMIRAIDEAARRGALDVKEVQVHINAEEVGDHVRLYLWNSHLAFKGEDVLAINRGLRPPSAQGRGTGFRLARATLVQAGGSLEVGNPEKGALVTLAIPLVYQAAY